jgi:hypothetical protein
MEPVETTEEVDAISYRVVVSKVHKGSMAPPKKAFLIVEVHDAKNNVEYWHRTAQATKMYQDLKAKYKF